MWERMVSLTVFKRKAISQVGNWKVNIDLV